MKSLEYIKRNLGEIVKNFPDMSFKCKYDKMTKTHIIDVQPIEYYKNNDQYALQQFNLRKDFDNKFFPESILFISDESLINVTNYDFNICFTKIITLNMNQNIKSSEKDLLYQECPNYALAS